MAPLTVLLVAGARPNFMKIAPLIRAMRKRPHRFNPVLVHTGQHYDHSMSQVFFDELGLPAPDLLLMSGGGSHAEQTAKIMVEFESVCRSQRPDHVLVVGDVNSTLACSITAKKMGITVSHVEAGLRSFDMTMPEEINRLVTDAICDWFFCTEQSGVENLLRAGTDPERVFMVGHVMIDNLFYQSERLSGLRDGIVGSSSIKERLQRYGVVTLHRPSNVDDPVVLRRILAALREISHLLPLVFPIHPRTRQNIKRFGMALDGNILTTEPLGYMDFLNLWKDAVIVLTDSGGLQEETTALEVPCLTLRENTERPVTVSEGTNELVGTNTGRIVERATRIISGHRKPPRRPALWDGNSAERIMDALDAVLPISHDAQEGRKAFGT